MNGYDNGMLWINEKQHRYYSATIQKDLFGNVVVMKSFGSTVTSHCRVLFELAGSKHHAREIIEQIGRKRIAHGYGEAMID